MLFKSTLGIIKKAPSLGLRNVFKKHHEKKSVKCRKAVGGISVKTFNFELYTQKTTKCLANDTSLIVSSLLGFLCALAVPAEYSTGGHLTYCSMT